MWIFCGKTTKFHPILKGLYSELTRTPFVGYKGDEVGYCG